MEFEKVGTTVRDVARIAGVSTTTVSRVLNGHASAIRISAETAARVRQVAETLHYRPNASALGLRTTKTRTIGVIAEDLLHPFTAELLGTVYEKCQARGYHLLLGHAKSGRGEGWELSTILHADRVDGVLLIGEVLGHVGEQEAADMMGRLVHRHRHVVSVGSRPGMAGVLAVTLDFAQGAYLALEYLVDIGHRTIGYVGQSSEGESWVNRQRRLTYQRFLRERGLPCPATNEVLIPLTIEGARDALQTMLARPDRPTALFVNNDFLAILLLRAARMYGIEVPADISIVGFDDIAFATLCSPSLTTVHYHIGEIGACAATALLDEIDETRSALGEATHSEDIVFTPTLVCRESTAPLLD
jgi:DNA-binding LacI/PurR family transcriptional regulator